MISPRLTGFDPTQHQRLQSPPLVGVHMRFGSRIGKLLGAIYANDSARTFAEDVFAFGLTRTTIDLFREYFMSDIDPKHRGLNIPAARERVIREISCIFTANFMGGMIAWAIAKGLHAFGYQNVGSQFIQYDRLALFKQLAQKSPTEKAFLHQVAGVLAHGKAPNVHQAVAGHLGQLLHTITTLPKPKGLKARLTAFLFPPKHVLSTSATLSRLLQPGVKSLTMPVHGLGPVYLETLLKEVTGLVLHQRNAKAAGHWGHAVSPTLQRSLRLSKLTLVPILFAAMAATIVAPYLNVMLTEKIDGIQSYPGKIGLTEVEAFDPQAKKRLPWYERLFPYMTQQARQQKPWALIISAIPLLFTFGFVDNVALSQKGVRKLPFGKLGLGLFSKAGLQKWLGLFQFRQGFPFSTGLQISALCAAVTTARLITVRDAIEFRERAIETYTSWTTWIVGLPILRNKLAGLIDWWQAKKGTPTMLTHHQPGQAKRLKDFMRPLLSEHEIGSFLAEPLKTRTFNWANRLNGGIFALTLGVIGVVEPYLAIKWTEWQVKRGQKPKPVPQPPDLSTLNYDPTSPGAVMWYHPVLRTRPQWMT